MARYSQTASLARFSSAGAWILTLSEPSMTPAISSRLARGCTRNENTTHPSRETRSSCWPAREPKVLSEPESVERFKTSPSALVLHGRLNLGVQFLRGAPRPVRIAQEFAR